MSTQKKDTEVLSPVVSTSPKPVEIRTVGRDGNIVEISTTSPRGRPTLNNVTVGRSGSAADLRKNQDGTVTVMRRQSGQEIGISVQRRLSSSSQPNITAVLGISTEQPLSSPMLGAADALEKTKGKGDFYEHLWPLDSLGEKYDTHLDNAKPKESRGLTEEKAKKLLEDFGPNVLTPPPKMPLWLLFLIQFTNLLMVLLLIVGTLCFILYAIQPNNGYTNLYLGALLYVAVFITCYETFSQEAKSDELMEKFRAMVPEAASVIRDGTMKPVGTMDIVPGDLIRLKTGDKIPADCRVIYSQSMKVDQAMITGESEPIDVSADSKSPVALESKNIIFNGSLVVDGECLAVAIRTGDGTLIGKMVDLTGDVGKASSTLQTDIVYFVRVLTAFALLQAATVFIVGVSRGIDPIDVFIQGFVTIMIGNVPQGLPTTITACLFIVAERMGRQNVFVKKLDIIETLGSCTCICTDKTGTLTQNLMSVANTWVFKTKLDYKEFSSKTTPGAPQAVTVQMRTLIDVAGLNSRVALEMKPSKVDPKKEELQPNGDATELGLYRFFGACIKNITGLEQEDYRSDNPKVHEIPFNSKNKWQMSIHAMKALGGKQQMFVKGAPDVLLSKCSRYLDFDGSIKAIDEGFNKVYNVVYDDFGGNGERVLGFALREMAITVQQEEEKDPKYKDVLKERLVGASNCVNPIRDLIFVGLVTLKDPPRDEVPQAIIDCYRAGVKVVMVTGDHPVTAEAIARQIGLITQPTRSSLARKRGVPVEAVLKNDPEIGAVVVRGVEISGSELEGLAPMTDEDWKVLLSYPQVVFARTSPENKLTIVNEFTKAGHITAMTGDGVNDSPALKQAAIGVAMGLNGSDVAREAGDLVLLDDNFASIVIGIREGRLLFANLKKSIAYSLAHLVPEVLPVLIWAYCGIPQPMGSMLCLCIDLLTELLPASAFAYEKIESLLMEQPPRNVKTDKLTSFPILLYAYGIAGMILSGGCFFVYFMTFKWYGVTVGDIFSMNNRFFPSSNDDLVFITRDGSHRIYDHMEQDHILAVIWGSWYLMIVCGQASHVFVCRTTTVSLFVHGVFTNMYTNVAVVVALLLGSFVTYTPGIQDAIMEEANPRSLLILYASLIVWGVLWSTSELRKWYSRSYPDTWLNKKLLGW